MIFTHIRISLGILLWRKRKFLLENSYEGGVVPESAQGANLTGGQAFLQVIGSHDGPFLLDIVMDGMARFLLE